MVYTVGAGKASDAWLLAVGLSWLMYSKDVCRSFSPWRSDSGERKNSEANLLWLSAAGSNAVVVVVGARCFLVFRMLVKGEGGGAVGSHHAGLCSASKIRRPRRLHLSLDSHRHLSQPTD